jgi:putative ABC transport system substrate-binding protein
VGSHVLALREVRAAAGSLGVPLQVLEASEPNHFDAVFATMAKTRVSGLLVLPDAMFILHRARVAELTAKHQLPSMQWRQ